MSRLSVFAALQRLAEERIRDAIQRGEFDNLPGRGKPLNLEDDRHIPEDLRLAYKVLKNAGCLPPELELKKEISKAEDLLSSMENEEQKYRQLQKLNFLIMKLNEMRRGSVQWEEKQLYYEKIVDKVGAGKGSKNQK